jgi:predicted DNA-binding transcriptional regulator YafY
MATRQSKLQRLAADVFVALNNSGRPLEVREIVDSLQAPERSVRAALRRLAMAGSPIVTGPGRTFRLARSVTQVETEVTRLRTLASSIQERADLLEAGAMIAQNRSTLFSSPSA